MGLVQFIGDPNIVKIGAGIQGDCQKLYRDFGINSRNCVELPYLAKSADNARWKGPYRNPIGLARLAEAYEERSLPKGRIRTSNWEGILDLYQQDC